jgi:nitrous oxide reductase accessory protein NosL
MKQIPNSREDFASVPRGTAIFDSHGPLPKVGFWQDLERPPRYTSISEEFAATLLPANPTNKIVYFVDVAPSHDTVLGVCQIDGRAYLVTLLFD